MLCVEVISISYSITPYLVKIRSYVSPSSSGQGPVADRLNSLRNLFNIVHVPCSKRVQYIESKNCTTLKDSSFWMYNFSTTCLGRLRPSSGRWFTKEIVVVKVVKIFSLKVFFIVGLNSINVFYTGLFVYSNPFHRCLTFSDPSH